MLVLSKLGAKVQYLPPGEIVAAFERGTIDAAEFSDPGADESLGLQRVASNYYYPSYHAPTTLVQLGVNLDKWNEWSDAQRGLIREACRQNIDQMAAPNAEALQKASLERIKSKGVQVRTFSRDILDIVRVARDEVVREFSAKDLDFKRVWESYISFQ